MIAMMKSTDRMAQAAAQQVKRTPTLFERLKYRHRIDEQWQAIALIWPPGSRGCHCFEIRLYQGAVQRGARYLSWVPTEKMFRKMVDEIYDMTTNGVVRRWSPTLHEHRQETHSHGPRRGPRNSGPKRDNDRKCVCWWDSWRGILYDP